MPVNAMSFLDSFGAGQQYRQQQEAMDMQRQERQRMEGMRNTQGKAQAALMGGDTQAAQQLAVGSGDAETMQTVQAQIAQMGQAERDAARERVRGLGSAAYTLSRIPAEQRQQWVRQNGQSLAALGMDPRQIAQMDLSDQNLGAFIAQAESMEQEFFAPYTLGENETRVTASGQQTIGQAGVEARGLEGRGLDIQQQNADTRRIEAQRPQSPLVSVNTGQQQLDPFQERMAAQEADNFAGFLEQAPMAQRNLARVDRLSQLLSDVDTGPRASLQAAMGRIGIPTEGLSEIQAAEALISAMIPDQRPPGSGVMSDADLELFRRSLPSLMNTPDGNRLIIDTIRGVNEYDVRLGQIAQAAASGQISRSEARQMVSQMQNPIDAIRQRGGERGQSQAVQIMSNDDYAQLAPGTRYIDPNGVERIKQ